MSTTAGGSTADDKGKAEDDSSYPTQSASNSKQDHLVSQTYRSILSSPITQTHSSVFVVSYEFYVTHGKADVFLDAWWKQEALLRSYWLGGYLSKMERLSESTPMEELVCDKFRGDDNRRLSSRVKAEGAPSGRKLRVGGLQSLIERKCKNCGKAASLHTPPVFSLYTEWKNKLAWQSALPEVADVASEEMKALFSKAIEHESLEMIVEQVPELLLDDFSTDDWADSSHATESVSELRYSGNADFSPSAGRKKKTYLRLTLVRARGLPRNAQGAPYTWTVQAGYSKILLVSSERPGGDEPTEWREEFHWKTSSRHRRIYLRVSAREQPELLGSHVIETREASAWPNGAEQWVDVSFGGDQVAQLLVSLERGVEAVDPVALFSVTPVTRGEFSEDSALDEGRMQLFKEIKADGLQTGDLVIFTGRGWVGGPLNRYEKKRWVQVGMVMVFAEYDMILVWELSPSNLQVKRDATTHLKFHMQLTDVTTKVTDGKYSNVGIRRLIANRTPEVLSNLMALRQTEHEHVVGDLLDIEETNELQDLTALVSAQLIAGAYANAGLLRFEEGVSQNDFSPNLWLSDDVTLCEGASLANTIWIERVYDKETKKFNI